MFPQITTGESLNGPDDKYRKPTPAPSNEYIELARLFRDLSAEERDDPNVIAQLNKLGRPGTLSWDDLLDCDRVVVLAEAGSGKTRELSEQKRKLAAQGKNAFFIPVEALQGENVEDYLAMEDGEAERFREWRDHSDETAWFFLDAVDELKLTSGKLDIALGKVGRAVGSARSRARFLLTCRPTDWRPVQDLEAFNKRLPLAPRPVAAPPVDDDAFLVGIRRHTTPEEPAEEAPQRVRIVVLEGLNDKQIKQFASAKGVPDPEAFLMEIRRREAWTFARRPLDLMGLIAMWRDHGKIGTRLKQHENDVVVSLRDAPERADAGVLSEDEAREGVERLALALALTRTRTIKVPEQSCTEFADASMLNADEVLSDWPAAKRLALLRRPIFDAATYGRVRFHHRSVAEYLAACRLKKLKAGGLPKRTLIRLLFAERYGEGVVIPSMVPVAAWLAIDDEDVRNFLLAREPEALVGHGDAESLPLEARQKLIRSYVAAYGAGGWRGLDLSITDLQRLAKPDLASEIRDLLTGNISNEEARYFLLKLIWLGGIGECADLVFAAAMDTTNDLYCRTVSIRALAECKRTDLLRKIADDMLSAPERWPDQVVHMVPESMFPSAISTAELVQFLETVPQGSDSVGGFCWNLYNLVDNLEAGSEGAVSLRRALADAIWRARGEQQQWYAPDSRLSFLTPALAKLCLAELRRGKEPDPVLVRDIVIANRFHGDQIVGREERQELRQYFKPGSSSRAIAHAAELAVMVELTPHSDRHFELYHAQHHGLVPDLTPEDWPWVLAAFKEAQDAAQRERMFHALLQVRGGDDWASRLEQLRAEIAAFPDLSEQLERMLAPRPPNPEMERMDAEHEAYKLEMAERDRERDESWLQWRKHLQENPGDAFSGEREDSDRWGMIRWLRGRARDRGHRSQLGLADYSDVQLMFGSEVADRFAASCKAYWRNEPPEVWSAKAEDQRNRSSGRPYVALTGLGIEAACDPQWAEKLSADEARIAAAWATTELNGFPEWFDALARQHPTAVALALEPELSLELDLAASLQFPRTLSALSSAGIETKAAVAPLLRERILSWPTEIGDGNPNFVADIMDRVRSILSAVREHDDVLAAYCKERFFADLTGPLAGAWQRGIFAYDFTLGIEALREALPKLSEQERREQAASWLGAMFGERGLSPSPISIVGDASDLKELAKLAYDCIRLEDDIHHEGVYTPGDRDEAESARNRIISTLINMPGEGAHDALLDLADEPLFAHMPDRLRMMAKRRAAADSEPSAFTEAQVREWERRFETKPQNADELFDVVGDRLSDMEFDLLHHDFGHRAQMLDLDETEIQPHIASYLHTHSRQQYSVTREPEAPDQKRRDVALAATAFVGKATIEIKVGDNCSVTDLEAAIRDQLVGQYLRHPENQVGYLLVTFAGRKKEKFLHPQTSARMEFSEVIDHLRVFAERLMSDQQGKVRLGVVGFDLRSPLPPKKKKPPAKKAGGARAPRKAKAAAKPRRKPSTP